MARKIQTRSDPPLAETHAAGAKISLVQPALHSTYGVLYVPRPNYWRIHLNSAERRYEELRDLDRRVLALPVQKSDSRTLEIDLTVALYTVGTDLIVQTILAMQQLVLELELTAKVASHLGDNLNTRLISVLKATGYPGDPGGDERYGQFGELQRVRDAIKHPTEVNVYNPNDGLWDAVPIAWIASGKALHAFEMTRDLILQVEQHYAQLRERMARPGSFEVQRGIRSLHQVKKPPKV